MNGQQLQRIIALLAPETRSEIIDADRGPGDNSVAKLPRLSPGLAMHWVLVQKIRRPITWLALPLVLLMGGPVSACRCSNNGLESVVPRHCCCGNVTSTPRLCPHCRHSPKDELGGGVHEPDGTCYCVHDVSQGTIFKASEIESHWSAKHACTALSAASCLPVAPKAMLIEQTLHLPQPDRTILYMCLTI